MSPIAKRGVQDVAGVQRRRRLEQHHVRLDARLRFVFDAARDDDDVTTSDDPHVAQNRKPAPCFDLYNVSCASPAVQRNEPST